MTKILIVEDDEFLREIIMDHLVESGYEVVGAANGKLGKEIALTGGFDLIVSDVQMPFVTGVELLKWVREQSSIPFILMTGFTNLLKDSNPTDLGAQGLLTKPFTTQQLSDQIKAVIGTRTSEGHS